MPKIRIPETVRIETDDSTSQAPKYVDPDPMFCRHFIRQMLLRDKSFGEDAEAVYCAMELRGIFDPLTVNPGDLVKLTNDQYRRLERAARKPDGGYNPAMAVHITSYIDAILKPEEK